MMNKALMISIQPQHAINILNGKKTLELRTWIPKGYVGWVYVYVTKGKPYLGKNIDGHYGLYNIPYFGHFNKVGDLNGKVTFRFWFDDYETYDFDNHGVNLYTDVEEYNVMYDDLERLCLDYREIESYGKGKTLYAWHIKQLEIFDKPKELSEFYKANLYTPYEVIKAYEETTRDLISYRLQRPPQSYQFVYVKELEKC